MVEVTDKTIPVVDQNGDEVKNTSWAAALPPKQGLYDPELEKDSCGVGFVWYRLLPSLRANLRSHIKGHVSHKIVTDGNLSRLTVANTD
jgi:hypothetical protein